MERNYNVWFICLRRLLQPRLMQMSLFKETISGKKLKRFFKTSPVISGVFFWVLFVYLKQKQTGLDLQ